jgi:hypothetical protein
MVETDIEQKQEGSVNYVLSETARNKKIKSNNSYLFVGNEFKQFL